MTLTDVPGIDDSVGHMTRVLVAGIGNIFLGDDGFGVAVAERLAGVALASSVKASSVKVADFGIRGVHLAYELLDGYDALVLIDAMPLGEAPGTLAIFEPTVEATGGATDGDDPPPALDAHSMNPGVVLGMLTKLGGRVERILVVGCEPESVEEGIGLSEPVTAAIELAVTAVTDLVAELCCVQREGE